MLAAGSSLFATTFTGTMGILSLLFSALVVQRAQAGLALNMAAPLSGLAFVLTGAGVWLRTRFPAGPWHENEHLAREAFTLALMAPPLFVGLLLIRRITRRSFGEWGWIGLIVACVAIDLLGLDCHALALVRDR